MLFYHNHNHNHNHIQYSDQFGRMESIAAFGQLHEFVPVEGLLPAAGPVLLQIMEYGLTFVEMACVLIVLLLEVLLRAALVDTFQFATLGLE